MAIASRPMNDPTTEPRRWVKDPLAILADGAERGIVIEGGRIVALVGAGREPEGPVDSVFDASAHVVLPGLINTHHHFYQNLTRALPAALGKELFPWLKSLYAVWARLDPEALASAVRVALSELMLSGLHHHLRSPLCVSQGTRARHRYRGRGRPCARHARDPHAGIDEPVGEGWRASTRFGGAGRGRHSRRQRTPRRRLSRTRPRRDGADRPGAMLALHGDEIADAPDRRSGRKARPPPAHPSRRDRGRKRLLPREMYSCRPLDYLEDCGWASPRVWVAHGVHFEAGEFARLARAGISVTHCPCSNQYLASGFCPVHGLEQAGVRVGLGVDGSASNNASNLIQEVRAAMLLQKLQYGSSAIGHRDAFVGPRQARRPAFTGRIWAPSRWARRPIWRCSGSTSCASPALAIRSRRSSCAAPIAPIAS